MISNAAESVETTFGNRRLLFQLERRKRAPWVMGDPRELEQVFVNLLTNARDASPDGSEVTCSVEDGRRIRPRRASATAARAFPPADADRLFEPFYTTKKSGGTGLGLAISRDIVRRHGGEIRLAPREGGGVEAVVTLPLSAPVS